MRGTCIFARQVKPVGSAESPCYDPILPNSTVIEYTAVLNNITQRADQLITKPKVQAKHIEPVCSTQVY